MNSIWQRQWHPGTKESLLESGEQKIIGGDSVELRQSKQMFGSISADRSNCVFCWKF